MCLSRGKGPPSSVSGQRPVTPSPRSQRLAANWASGSWLADPRADDPADQLRREISPRGKRPGERPFQLSWLFKNSLCFSGFILEQNGKLVALEIKSSSQASPSDASGLHALKGVLKKSESLVCSVVLHTGKARPLDRDIFALLWSLMVKDCNLPIRIFVFKITHPRKV